MWTGLAHQTLGAVCICCLDDHKPHRQALAMEEVDSRLLDAHNKIPQTSARLAAHGESDDDDFMQLPRQSLQGVSAASSLPRSSGRTTQPRPCALGHRERRRPMKRAAPRRRRRLQPRPRALRRERLPSLSAPTVYTPPARKRIQELVEQHVHRPRVPDTVQLMSLRA
jgi:hypothetical protein